MDFPQVFVVLLAVLSLCYSLHFFSFHFVLLLRQHNSYNNNNNNNVDVDADDEVALCPFAKVLCRQHL